MDRRRTLSLLAAGSVASLLTLPLLTGTATAAPHQSAFTAAVTPSAARQQAFATAARSTGVPASVLLAISYQESQWETHDGKPSMAGGYGPMHLTDLAGMRGNAGYDARGDAARPQPQAAGVDETLLAAAALSHQSVQAVHTQPAANITAGATLLASMARRLHGGSLPTSVAGWYSAVADYSGSPDAAGAQGFADLVFGTLRTGESRTTADGQHVTLTADHSVTPDRDVSALHLATPATASATTPTPECPATLDCDFIPAAYARNSPDPGDYGNYDLANRPKNLQIHYIVIHDTEETYADTIKTFQNSAAYAAAHYVVRSADGHVTQSIQTKNVAFQAGNWYINMHSIGIEHEGFAEEGGTWYTEALYEHSAMLVDYLAHRFNVPLDRQHIIGHDNVPGINTDYIAGMHWDPAVYWDWSHYMSLLGAPLKADGTAKSGIVTINPKFSTNNPKIRSCDGTTVLPRQGGSDAVYLRTGPTFSAPLFTDEGLHYTDKAAGSRKICDWGDRAATGQQFAVAARSGSWTAIWYSGHKVWFYNPASAPTAMPAQGYLVKPKRASIPVWGEALPNASEWPSQLTPYTTTPLLYPVGKGQSYVLGGTTPTDYYYAKTIDSSLPLDHTVIVGSERYYEIQLNHRQAFVNVKDVVVVPSHR